MGLVGFAIFFFWPTAIPHAAGLRETGGTALSWLKQVDAAGNACPSLHVAFAVFSGLWLDRALTEMRLPIAFDADRGRAERILLEAAERHAVPVGEIQSAALS